MNPDKKCWRIIVGNSDCKFRKEHEGIAYCEEKHCRLEEDNYYCTYNNCRIKEI